MRPKRPACVRRDRSARTGEPQRSVSRTLPRSLIHSFCRLSPLISDEKGASFRGKWCSHTKAWKCAYMLRKGRSSVKASALRAKFQEPRYSLRAMLDLLTTTPFLTRGGADFLMLCVSKGINLLPRVFHNASFAREERYQSSVFRYNRESSPTNFSFNFFALKFVHYFLCLCILNQYY